MDDLEIQREKHESSLGEAALDGLVNGLLAGVIMALYVLFAGRVVANNNWAYFGYLDFSHSGVPGNTLFTQMAVSAIYGAAFGMACQMIKPIRQSLLPRWLAGLVYGGALWMLVAGLILPRDNFTLMPLAAVYLLFAYLVYGLILGLRQRPWA